MTTFVVTNIISLSLLCLFSAFAFPRLSCLPHLVSSFLLYVDHLAIYSDLIEHLVFSPYLVL